MASRTGGRSLGALVFAAAAIAAISGVGAGGSPAAMQYGGGPPPGARSGQIVFASDRADGARELYVVERDGTGVRRLTFNGVFERRPVWSPDRSRIAFSGRDAGGQWDLYTVAAGGGDLRQVTNDAARDDLPSWTADGTQLVFTRYATASFDCPCEAWFVNADGSGSQKLATGPGDVVGADASPVGRRLVVATTARGRSDLYVMDVSGSGSRRITDAPAGTFGDFYPRWSPDGTQIAFLRDTTGTDNDVWVVRANGGRLLRLTSTPDLIETFLGWSPSGDEVLTSAGDPVRLLAMPASGGPEAVIPTALTAPLDEGFDDGIRDASVWHDVVTGTETSIAETDGSLQVSIGADAVAGGPYNVIEGHWGLQCSLPADYDVQVDYRLLNWPATNGVRASLWAFFTNVQLQRESQTWGEQYFAWLGGQYGYASTADGSGAMRLVRSGGTVSAYWLLGGSWVPLGSAANSGDAVVGLGATSDDSLFHHEPVRVSFDNLRVASGTFSCPSWWNGIGPDWG